MIICPDHKLLYLAPPKTGSVSVIRKIEAVPPFNGSRFDNNEAHHSTVWQPKFDDYYIFITVRHPYTRMVSLWRFAVRQVIKYANREKQDCWTNFWHRIIKDPTISLTDFMKIPVFRHRFTGVWRCTYHTEQIPRSVDKVVHQEKFHEDLASIPALKDIDFGHENTGVSNVKPWYAEYSDESLIMVNQLWSKDFSQFGYNRNFKECVEGKLFLTEE